LTGRLGATLPEEPLLYSIEQAAALLGIGRTFMYQLVTTGEIDSVKVGKRRKVPRDAVTAYIDRLRAEQASCTARLSGHSPP
jgi:excisionase family DNA binding protein